MSSYKIAVIPGDGTGPEVVAEGIKVLNAVAGPAGIKFDYTYYDLGGERYKRTGETLPDSVIAELRQFPAIYLGAIGHPDVAPGILEKGILLKARFELDQYINLRGFLRGSARAGRGSDRISDHRDQAGHRLRPPGFRHRAA